ncbi:uncharacterized protein LOC136000028 [Caloenas nicobarica]|uniref:uncharacterized protein LOC136000028 n=1 Tax=Caloenas nicobarica TaxID=187106 RepID=UPI0032B79450
MAWDMLAIRQWVVSNCVVQAERSGAGRGGAAGLQLPCCSGGGRPSRADAAGGSRRRLCPCRAGGAAPAQVGAAGGGPAARGWALPPRGVPALPGRGHPPPGGPGRGPRPRRPLPCSPLRRPPPSPAGPPRTPLRARLPPALRPFPASPRGPRATRTRCSVAHPPGPPWIRPWRHRRWEGLGWGRAGCSEPRDTPAHLPAAAGGQGRKVWVVGSFQNSSCLFLGLSWSWKGCCVTLFGTICPHCAGDGPGISCGIRSIPPPSSRINTCTGSISRREQRRAGLQAAAARWGQARPRPVGLAELRVRLVRGGAGEQWFETRCGAGCSRSCPLSRSTGRGRQERACCQASGQALCHGAVPGPGG